MWVIAHRGASACAPENTLAAFRLAVEQGAGFIETDLQLSRDAHLVAIHDDTLDRTTNGRGPVAARTLEELRRLDAGSRFRLRRGRRKNDEQDDSGERIPTIEEVLAFGREHDVGLYLELKAGRLSGAEAILAGALRAAGAITRSVVISFDLRALETIRSIEPLIATGYLFKKKTPDAVQRALGAGARQLLPRADCANRDLIAEAHENDLKVVVWTVDEPARMKALIAAGVDGIITNVPDRLVALLGGGPKP